MPLRLGDRLPHSLLVPDPGGYPFVVKLSVVRRSMTWIHLSDSVPHPLLLPHPRPYPLVIEPGIPRERTPWLCPGDRLPNAVLLPAPRVRHGKIDQIRDPYPDSSS